MSIGATPTCDVFLVGADLDERRLLYAQLREEGYDVMATTGVHYAVAALAGRLVSPRLILVDVRDDAHATPSAVEDLAKLASGSGVVVLVGAVAAEAWEPLRPRLAALVRRPVTVGQVVDTVRRVLPIAGAS